jgi:hypothetical protein
MDVDKVCGAGYVEQTSDVCSKSKIEQGLLILEVVAHGLSIRAAVSLHE